MERLSDEIGGIFPREKKWPVRTETDGTGLEYRFYIDEVPSVDPDWALSAGEVMFNLRASLDYLAFELHLRRFRGNLPRGVEGVTQFPIYRDIDKFRRNYYRVERLSQRDRRALRHLQPDITRRDQWQGVRRWLDRLNALHNVDKHRKLHLVAAAQNTTHIPQFLSAPLYGLYAQPIRGAVEPSSMVEKWTFAKPPPPPAVPAHPGAFLEVVIEQEGYGEPVLLVLTNLVINVRAVLDRFADRFER